MDNSNTRYSLLDSLRGFAVINMIAYHFIYDLKFIFARDIGWFGNFGTYLWEQGICILFILISGICANFGRNKLRRGITLLLCGSAITVVTSLMLPNEAVHFGVLSFIGSAVLLMIPLEKLISRLNPVPGLIGSFALFALTKQIDNGFLGFFTSFIFFSPIFHIQTVVSYILQFTFLILLNPSNANIIDTIRIEACISPPDSYCLSNNHALFRKLLERHCLFWFPPYSFS